MEKARRYNKGKLRMELIPVNPLKDLAEVYTKGAHKYSVYKDKDGNEILGMNLPIDKVNEYTIVYDAAENWRKGMSWMETIGAVKRHLAAWESGEDYDPELLTKHLSNATWGLMTLMEYYKTHPELDDRPHKYLQHKKIGLDIDEVLADFVGAYCKKFDLPIAQFWNFDKGMNEKFKELSKDKDFWLTLPVKLKANELPFEPYCYITSRSIPQEWTEEWLHKNGFPSVPVYSVPFNTSKLEAIKKSNIDIFVDDKYDTFIELNKAGILCYLYDVPHNQKYNVGHKRIKNLKELL